MLENERALVPTGIHVAPETLQVFATVEQLAKDTNSLYIGTDHLLIACMRQMPRLFEAAHCNTELAEQLFAARVDKSTDEGHIAYPQTLAVEVVRKAIKLAEGSILRPQHIVLAVYDKHEELIAKSPLYSLFGIMPDIDLDLLYGLMLTALQMEPQAFDSIQ